MKRVALQRRFDPNELSLMQGERWWARGEAEEGRSGGGEKRRRGEAEEGRSGGGEKWKRGEVEEGRRAEVRREMM
jgi:hypothetical protein